MKDFYEYGARNNLCIWTKYGRVHKISFVSDEKNNKVEVLERGTSNKQDFLYVLKEFMKNQAKYKPGDFMELYIGLTDDTEANEIADQIYRTYIDKEKYPVDIMRKLKNEPTPKKNVGEETFGENEYNYILVKEGIVTLLKEGSMRDGRVVDRKDGDFCKVLLQKLKELANKDPKGFMSFYHMVEDSDEAAFAIAEKVRKNKIENTNAIFNS